jgi:potassium efflux system protein
MRETHFLIPLLKRLVFVPVFLLAILLAQAQDNATAVPASAAVKEAAAAAEADEALSEEDRTTLLDNYRRVQSFLSKREEYRQKSANYSAALESASSEASKVSAQLEKDMADYEGKEPAPPTGMKLAEAESALQSAQADLASAEARGTQLAEDIQAQTDRPDKIRARTGEGEKLLDQLRGQAVVAEDSASPASVTAQSWLQSTQIAALAAELKMLEQELLSQPVRLELLKAQQEAAAFDVRRLRSRVKILDQLVVTRKQEEAQQVLSEVASTQESVADAHPKIRELAEANTVLTAEISARTATLEDVKKKTDDAAELAQRFENDLENIQRKLSVLGMSEALGRVLREQQLRLPRPLYSRSDVTRREDMVSDSSLRQLVYEDERRKLRSLSDYVAERTSELPAEEAEALREDLTGLARTRRDLIGRAIDTESTYLQALGDLDFETRRVESSATAYRHFISERLLWIRSASPYSLDTAKAIPVELTTLMSPGQWWTLLTALPGALLSSVWYPLALLLFAVLLRYHRRMLELLERSAVHVGKVSEDTFGATLQALLLTAMIASTWPLLMMTLGIAIDSAGPGERFDKAVAYSLERVSRYYFGLEFLRYLLVSQGVVRRHFQWNIESTRKLLRKLWQLELVFIPTILFTIMANRSSEAEGQSVVASIGVIVALIAIARFIAVSPSMMQGQLTRWTARRSSQRRSLISKTVRYVLILLPVALVVCVVLGYQHTAIEFTGLLIATIALFAGLLLLHGVGFRWLRLMRLRLIETERQAALQAAGEAAENPEHEKDYVVDFDEPDPDALGEEGKNLLNSVLLVAGIFGVWGVWNDVLPALGILDTIELWSTTEVIGGLETAIPVTPIDIIQVLLITFVGYVAVQRLPSLLELFLRQKMELAAGTVYAGVTLIRYVLVGTFVIVVLGMLGASWGSIQWAVAALSVGIGFGLQEIVANFISGLILLFEQPIRVGDTVTVGETSGVITKIRMRATTVRDWDGRELLVPNKEFITGRLLNWSLSDTQSRIIIEIGIAYGSDVPKAMKLALDAAKEHPDILKDPEAFITFDAFGDNSLLLRLRAYLPNVDRRLGISSELRQAVNDKYNEAGIVIAFPQRDIHLNTLAPLEVHVVGNEPATPGTP